MNKILTIIKREYKDSVYKKSFIIMTFLMPVLMIGLSVVPSLLIRMDTAKPSTLHVIDRSEIVFDNLKTFLQDTLENGGLRYRLSRIEADSANLESAIEEEKELIRTDKITGLIIIPANVEQEAGIRLMAKNVANFNLNQRIQYMVGQIVSTHKIQKSGLDPQLVAELTKPVRMRTIKITKSGEESERGFMEEYFGTFVFVLILYMTLLLYGASIMRSIVHEKSSRIIEVLLSGANSFQLMAGKIFGQGAVGLTQYLLWAAFGISFVTFGKDILPVSTEYFNFSPEIFVYFVLFYILGYFIYSVLYAAIGAMTNSDEEAQQFSFPVVMLLIIPLVLTGYIVKNPDSSLAVTMSMIPFFSPIVMFARINLSSPPFIEILASIFILVLTIFILIWIVSRIYRVGILMYGKRPNLVEIIKWMRYK